ncbi:hypothetical protein BV898_00944 [Hypsibius exemplaris]|uniref:Uncharacterized protein n=1 Tax=Hypsibius exemplaris TaxID=2072580 RepID=A0A1W0XCS7_HYPEX|nr:hypothetical protein BV898_00944 [Hypsibius exemplaris]
MHANDADDADGRGALTLGRSSPLSALRLGVAPWTRISAAVFLPFLLMRFSGALQPSAWPVCSTVIVLHVRYILPGLL